MVSIPLHLEAQGSSIPRGHSFSLIFYGYLLILLLIVALQLFMQSFGLLNQFLPSSSILDKGLPIWHF